jgi:hypothetical protein
MYHLSVSAYPSVVEVLSTRYYRNRLLTNYRLANACSIGTLTEQTTELVGSLYDPPRKLQSGEKAWINVVLICLTTVSHCFGVQVCTDTSNDNLTTDTC